MATTPNFASILKTGTVQISTANTNRDGSGTMGTLLVSGTNGSRIDFLKMIATGTTTSGMLRLFITSGTNTHLYAEIPVTAVTPSGSAEVWQTYLTSEKNPDIMPIILGASQTLRVATHNSETFNIFAAGGDF